MWLDNDEYKDNLYWMDDKIDEIVRKVYTGVTPMIVTFRKGMGLACSDGWGKDYMRGFLTAASLIMQFTYDHCADEFTITLEQNVNSYIVSFILYTNWLALQKDLDIIDADFEVDWKEKITMEDNDETHLLSTTNKPDVDVCMDKVPVASVQVESSQALAREEEGYTYEQNHITFAVGRSLQMVNRFMGIRLMKKWEMYFHFYLQDDATSRVKMSMSDPMTVIPHFPTTIPEDPLNPASRQVCNPFQVASDMASGMTSAIKCIMAYSAYMVKVLSYTVNSRQVSTFIFHKTEGRNYKKVRTTQAYLPVNVNMYDLGPEILRAQPYLTTQKANQNIHTLNKPAMAKLMEDYNIEGSLWQKITWDMHTPFYKVMNHDKHLRTATWFLSDLKSLVWLYNFVNLMQAQNDVVHDECVWMAENNTWLEQNIVVLCNDAKQA